MTVQIIADSLNAVTRTRCLTAIFTYPRRVHSEIMTHRMFSRNAESSRAIPIAKMIELADKYPSDPIHWGKKQKGMQAYSQLEGDDLYKVRRVWDIARKSMIAYAKMLDRIGAHKQLANRLLEPFIPYQVIITATEWDNFFALRCADDAHPEIALVADEMLAAYLSHTPTTLYPREWHIPFADKHIDPLLPLELKLKIATARCARISYANYDGEFTPEKDYALHDDLVHSGHWSAFEHCAVAADVSRFFANFRGFRSYRSTFGTENRTNINLWELAEKRRLKERGML